MKTAAAIAMIALAAPALAAPDETSRIVVTGTATSEVLPDRATITFSVRGEGATADEAMRAMVARKDAILAGFGRFRETGGITTGEVSVNEVRGRECQGYQPQLSVGACAILGYRALLEGEIRTATVKDAGTMVGLIGRLGGTNPRVGGFGLADDGPARGKAAAAAFAEARQQAEALAAAGHVRLGRLLSVSDGSYSGRPETQDIVVAANRVMAPAPPLPPPPIAVDITPRPIRTQARVTVSYEIVP